MVSLIGKFGEPGKSWEPCGRRTELGPYGVWYDAGIDGFPVRFRNIAWNSQREEITGESYWSIPAIAAWITAAGRCQLLDYLLCAGWDHVWYCDTDSVLTDTVGLARMRSAGHIRDGVPGFLRLIGTYDRVVIRGYRHYEADGAVKCSGVPRGEIYPGETREEFWRRRTVAEDLVVGKRPAGELMYRHYYRADRYTHGEVLADGTVIPWRIGDA